MPEMMPNFQSPEQIRKMVDSRERANEAKASLENEIQAMMANETLTEEDIDELFEKIKSTRSSQTLH